VITPGIYVHHIEVADQNSVSGSLYANLPSGDGRSRTVQLCARFNVNAQNFDIIDGCIVGLQAINSTER